MASNFDILIGKLDRFIRRYYLNLLLKGSLFFAAGFIILFLLVSTLEYFGYFSTTVRFVIFYGFAGYNVLVFIRYVLIPLMGFVRIGRRIGTGEAARILGAHFRTELRDKVTNALQLKQYLDHSSENQSIVAAAIDQKAALASGIPFSNAVNLKSNLRYLPFVLLPLVIGAAVYLLKPGFFAQPVNRIIRYDTHFERPAPFSIHAEDDFTGFRNENLDVKLFTRGTVIPSSAEIRFNGQTFRLEKSEKDVFSHTFRNLQESFQFFVHAEGFRFGPFPLKVVNKPSFAHFNLNITPPAYTGLERESFMNIGDINVAEGSLIEWEFNTRGTGEAIFHAGQEKLEAETVSAGIYRVRKRAFEPFNYRVVAINEEVGEGDSLRYYVQVRKDQYPRIQIESYQDSVMLAHLFHRGIVQDDYGFTRLEFAYRIIEDRQPADRADASHIREKIEIDNSSQNQTFFHHFDARSVYLRPGETIEYFYEVFDNDAINGPKSAKSRFFTFHVPGRDELLAQTRQDEERIREELGGGMGDVQDARQDLDNLRRQMLESDRMSWEQQESVRELLNRQKEIEERIDQLSEFKKQSETRNEQFSETNERVREKQEELQRIFEELMSDELKELFEKIREELDRLDRDQIYDMLSKMDFEMRDLENQLDRALELFKQLEMERMLQESLDMLSDLKKEQQELTDDTKQGQGEDQGELSDRQQELSDEMEKLSDLLQEFREKNEELSRPKQVDDTSDLEQEIGSDMQDAQQELERNNSGGAQQKQQNATQKMDRLSQRLQGMQQSMFMEELAEDARALRQILENLLKASFSQEDLLLVLRSLNINDPRYVDFIQEQRKIKEDLSMIEDSLIALSKRQVQIQSYVTREIGQIQLNIGESIMDMIERRVGQAVYRQQFVMTHINNLALLLNESLQNMMMQMQMAGQGGEGQQMPGGSGGEPSFRNMRQMQEELNQMLQQMQQGHQPMPGQTGETPMSQSEALARMAAEQEAIRRELQRMGEKLKQEGVGDGKEFSDLQLDMERTELDIVRREISRMTLLRQEMILTRLLEHERAEMQREMEEKRVGNTAYNYEISNPEEIFQYNSIRNRELEMLRSLPPGLKPFYRSMVENYFLNVQE